MYLPQRFREADVAAVRALARAHPFASLVTAPIVDGTPAPFVSHLPLLLELGDGTRPDLLRGHMARANPQWRHFEGGEVLAVFSGPHAFVSSMWSERPDQQVPTWNYLVAHAYGRARVLEDPSDTLSVLAALMAAHQPEASPVALDPPAPLAIELVRAIVAFEIPVARWEAKSKLSQNRTAEDRALIEERLRSRGALWDREIADAMARTKGSTDPSG